MARAADADLSTDEDEEEEAFRLERIKGKTPEEITAMNKKQKKLYTVVFNVFQVNKNYFLFENFFLFNLNNYFIFSPPTAYFFNYFSRQKT